jgi:enamine deaminase RidA (YjgF/YER057c/UK114 family)
VKQVIQASGVMAYEPFGFTNCVRFKDVLYLSGISALDPEGKVVGADIETQTQATYRNIQKVLRAAGSDLDQILQMTSFHRRSADQRLGLRRRSQENSDPHQLHQCHDRRRGAHDPWASARSSVHRRDAVGGKRPCCAATTASSPPMSAACRAIRC